MKIFFPIIILIFVLRFPGFSQTVDNSCPQITLSPPNEMLVPDKAVLFTAVNGKETYQYDWTASSGFIMKGQGTSKIEFLPVASDFGKNVTITLEINGLPKTCVNKISETVSVIPKIEAEPFSQYGKISTNDEKAQIENLYHYISPNEGYECVMLLEFDKKTPSSKKN